MCVGSGRAEPIYSITTDYEEIRATMSVTLASSLRPALVAASCSPNRATVNPVFSFSSSISAKRLSNSTSTARCSAIQEKEAAPPESSSASVEEVTKKFGLEAGLWKIFTSKDKEGSGDNSGERKKNQAKELLARYGGAYLVTSISLSLVSFSLCYLLISIGVDVQGLLDKIGIHTDETGEKVGTLALAYAAHKAASPIRFPPTVALTPIVASWFGNKSKQEQGKKSN